MLTSVRKVFSLAQLLSVCLAIHWGYGNPWESLADIDKAGIEKVRREITFVGKAMC